MTRIELLNSFIAALDSTGIYHFVTFYKKLIMASGPSTDLMCIALPNLQKKSGRDAIYLDTMIMVKPHKEITEAEIFNAFDSKLSLILPYVVNHSPISDFYFSDGQICSGFFTVLEKQISDHSLEKNHALSIISSQSDHPIKKFQRVYGDEFSRVITNRLASIE